MLSSGNQRKDLCRFLGWFLVANAVLFILVGLNLVATMMLPFSNTLVTWRGAVADYVFLVVTYIGFYGALAAVVSLPSLIITLLMPRWRVTFVISVLVMTLVQWYLFVDSIVYHLYHFHMQGVIWALISSGAFFQVIDLSRVDYAIMAMVLVLMLLIESMLALWVWRRLHKIAKPAGRMVALVIVMMLLLSITLLAKSISAKNARQYYVMSKHLIVSDSQVFPWYENILGPLLYYSRSGAESLVNFQRGFFKQLPQVSHHFNYPHHSLICHSPKKPLNIVVIGVDTMRYDMLAPATSPHMYAYAKHSIEFHDHISSGNSTQPGLFGLFYSIPPTYWTAALKQHKGSILIDQLLKHHYQMGVYLSAPMMFPAFDKTIFIHLPHKKLTTPGDTAYQRDQKITQEFVNFINKRNRHRPFFSFLFYDAVHSYCDRFPRSVELPFAPYVHDCNHALGAISSDKSLYFNRYKDAVFLDDALVNKVLLTLKSHHLTKHTVVIITADHGNAFDDDGLGYWGHASGYNRYQTQVPMIVHWPSYPVMNVDYKTCHYDVVPTLLHRVLHCDNANGDYSVGGDLFHSQQRPFLIVGSYIDYAVLTHQNITVIYPQGNYMVQNLQGKAEPDKPLNIALFAKAQQQMSAYFAKH